MFYVFIPGARFARLPRRRRARAGGRGFPAALLPAALPRPTPDGAGGLCRRPGLALGRSGRSGPVQRYQPASQLPVLASKMEKQILSFFSSSFFFFPGLIHLCHQIAFTISSLSASLSRDSRSQSFYGDRSIFPHAANDHFGLSTTYFGDRARERERSRNRERVNEKIQFPAILNYPSEGLSNSRNE